MGAFIISDLAIGLAFLLFAKLGQQPYFPKYWLAQINIPAIPRRRS